MTLSSKYASIRTNLRNITKEIALRILNVLEDSGSAILKSEHLGDGGYITLDKILILSEPMKRSLEIFRENLKRIGESDRFETGSQYYIAEYGGSKTQYIELLISQIRDLSKRDEPPFTQIIPVVFNGTLDLTASFLGEKIENETARLLTRQLEFLQRQPGAKVDSRAFETFMNLLI